MGTPIPIVGGAYVIKGWYTTFNIECQHCRRGDILTLISNQPTECPTCGARFQFLGFASTGAREGETIMPHELGIKMVHTAPTIGKPEGWS